jgi:iron(III) transport system permease protein
MRTSLSYPRLAAEQRRPLHVLAGRVWSLAPFAVALAVALPALVVFSRLTIATEGVWSHLLQTVLWDYALNSILLALGVAGGVIVIGVGTAWLVSMCRFPGRATFEWALLLPLAVPTYIIAYTYTDFLQFAGPVQSALRDMTGWRYGDYWFPNIRSLGGAITVMMLVLYPYVYLLSRAAFLEQSTCALDVGRTLGRGAWGCFFGVAIPLARPAIAGGTALAIMEALADFGAVQHFGVSTFTTGIYRTWFSLGEPVAAAQLAAVLMLFVLLVLTLERVSRGPARFEHTATYRPWRPYALHGGRAALACSACAAPIALGFGVPALVLIGMTLEQGDELLGGMFLRLASNSFTLAMLAAALTGGLALIVGYGLRLRPTPFARAAARTASLGYAVPGAVIAVGVLIPFARFDNALDAWMRATFGISTGLLLTGTIAILLFAYLVRFFAVALSATEAGLAKINHSLDDAARMLGESPTGTLLRVHVPIMWGSVLTALIMVFVDVLKELPATLILRPFDFETLAVRVYRFASDERLAEASTPALAIVLVGLIPVILLSRAMSRTRDISGAPNQEPPNATVAAAPSSGSA